MSPRVDLLVVGAGPAGTAAGMAARAHGLDVTVLDRATFPRDKTCGDGLTAAALAQLEALGVAVPALPAAPVNSVVVVAPDRWQVELPLPGPGLRAAVVERATLDQALLDRARQRGVRVVEGTAVEDVVEEPDGVRVRTASGEELEARFVVAADGHYSSVRRRHGRVAPDLGTWHAVRQYYRQVGDPRLWVLFEPDLLPGYAWVFPLPGGRANVGFGVLRGAGHDGKALNALWRDLLTRPALLAALGPRAEPEASHRAWPIPTVYSRARLADGRVLYAGDAAGVVDPMTGEGIAQALESGALAAAGRRGGRRAGRDPRPVPAGRRPGPRPGPALRVVPAGAAALPDRHQRRHPRRGLDRVDAPQLRPLDVRGLPAAAAFTPDRWRHQLFTPPGAFRASA